MWSQASGEHAGAPRPPGWLQATRPGAAGHAAVTAMPLRVQALQVDARMQRLLLAGVGDLGDEWQGALQRVPDAAVVAVAHCKDTAIAPGLPDLSSCWLKGDLQKLVEVDPATATGALVAEHLCRHEVVGCLDTDADIRLVRSIRQIDLVPEFCAALVILNAIVLLDVACMHVLKAVLLCALRQGSKAVGQGVNESDLDVREEVLQLSCPLDSDEASANNEDSGLLLVELINLVVLLENVASASLNETLIDMAPLAQRPVLLMDHREPERLPVLLEWAKVAPCADDAVVERQGVHG
mmetsp:Transcript_60920/g.132144  ORF Transcript_60920/g.132144 Transcript_60920/m.132144 type:complete len:296 (+) Transcript_60920:438-1325(+)